MKRTITSMLLLILICLSLPACKKDDREREAFPDFPTIDGPIIPEETVLLSKDDKKQKLLLLENEMENNRIGSSEHKKLAREWLDVALLETTEPAQALLPEDLQYLSHLAYIIGTMRTYRHVQELERKDMVSAIAIYYCDIHNIPSMTYRGEEEKLPVLPADDFVNRDYYVLENSTANLFLRSVFGVEIPQMQEDFGEYLHGCFGRDGVYYIMSGDYESYYYYVSQYKYLGNDLFLVVFDADSSGFPLFDEDMNIIDSVVLYDAAQMIVKRTDSIWKFNVIAKLKDVHVHSHDDRSTIMEIDPSMEMVVVRPTGEKSSE